MGKIIETKITRFDGGIVADGRDPRENVCQMSKHFDIFTRPYRLVPHVAPESGNSDQTTHGIRQMLYYNSKVFGLGVTTSPPRVYEKSSLANATWTELTNGTASSGSFNPNVFVEYKGYVYGWYASANLWKADLSGSAAFTTTERSITGVGVQGLVHSKDDILYLPYNVSGQGKIAKLDNTTWSDASITLPVDKTITAICEYGNYIAIACKPKYYGKSVVYLWDRDSTLTTLSESIDFGSGDLEVLEELDGYLIGISLIGNSTTALKPRVVFRRYGGAGSATVFKELEGSSAVGLTLKGKQKVGSRLYFLLGITIDGTTLQGVWVIARSSSSQEFAVAFSHDPVISGGSAINSLTSFFLVGDYMFCVFNDGSDTLTKTNDSPATTPGYNISSIYESQIFNSGDSSLKKDLVGVSVSYEPLPTNGEVTLKYRKDAETSWTTIFTDTTDDSVSHSAVNIESSGALVTDFKEIQFRLESKGGAEITGFSFKTEITGKRLYE